MGIFDAIGSLVGPNFAGPSGNILNAAYSNQILPALQGGLTNVNQLYGQAIPYLQQQFQQALPYQQQVFGTGQAGQQALNTLLGIGPGGQIGDPTTMSTALSYLQGTPGYRFAKTQGQGAIDAANAASGKLASGNLITDLAKYTTGLADQTYQGAVSNLAPYTNMFTTGANNLGNLFTGLGTGVSNLLTGQAGAGSPFYQQMANAGQWLGGTQANLGAQQGMLNAALGGNLLGGLLNFGGSLLGGFGLSDERLKEDIKPVGKLFDDTRVFSFRYKGEPRTHIGLLAQEIETKYPEAVAEFGGVKFVNYEKATRPSSAIAALLKAA